ncbi:MAG: lysophospholipid acyltransferase family protein [Campylobacterota bacterium]|nr:lysophospholipid acyltransferase family protein [Campylobacterota bacterium]
MRKKIFRALALLVVPFLGSLLMRFLNLTNRSVFHAPESFSDEPIIFACWHGELLMVPFFYNKIRKVPRAKILISPHFDGELISKTVKYFGMSTLAGSSDKNPARVLIQALKTLKEGPDIGITPDGPKGPRREVVADGIIVMAQKTGSKIVLIEVKPTKFWQFNSWDKFVVPKPFGTINFYASRELDISTLEIQEARELIKKGLLQNEN